jgi:hypothetical protein
VTGDRHAIGSQALELELGALLARLKCEHSHGSRRPRRVPCRRHRDEGAWWGYVLTGHVDELEAALREGSLRELEAALQVDPPVQRGPTPATLEVDPPAVDDTDALDVPIP